MWTRNRPNARERALEIRRNSAGSLEAISACSFRQPFLANANKLDRSVYRRALAIVNIVVRENNVEQALRALKKKMQREGTFREMKRRKFYEKPSEKKARQKAEAVRRARKLQRKRMQREGII
ncbi:30S ribosomal protein S21 [Aquisalinus flavus]|nr:30S ribosomal protein S21 [Aquisalinus flavus]UNE46804.1 30S ribosomal protein S21 [Aquisalinus flavus]